MNQDCFNLAQLLYKNFSIELKRTFFNLRRILKRIDPYFMIFSLPIIKNYLKSFSAISLLFNLLITNDHLQPADYRYD